MQSVFETLEGWADGVNTTLQAHTLPPTASPRAWNSVLVGAGSGQAVFGKRRGFRLQNATPITGSPAIVGQVDFRVSAGASITPYHLLISDNGRFDKLQADLTTVAADTVTPAPFTSGAARPDWAMAQNFLYIVNGTDKKKFDGTTVWNFGITRPSAAPTVTDSGVAGTPNGTYEGVLVYYNSATGSLSSRSDPTSVTVSSHQIDFSWTAPADPQVTHVIVGIRNTANEPFFYQAAQIAIGTTTYRFNLDTTTLTIQLPDTAENNPPPDGITNLEYHTNRRMFATDGVNLYYSKRDFVEAFDPDNIQPVNPNDGQRIRALHSAHGVLIILKERSVYILSGDEPESWTLSQLDPEVGTFSHQSVFTVNSTTFFWSELGAMGWAGSGPVVPIAAPKIRPTVSSDMLNFSVLDQVVGTADSENKLCLWGVPAAGDTRNTCILPYNYEVGQWVADKWDPMDVASLAFIRRSSDNVPRVFLGGYAGQVFQYDTGVGNDGIPVGSTNKGSVSSATSSTLVDASATFETSGGKLIERYVTAIDPAKTHVQRRRITTNTATELTVTPDWSMTPNDQWTYVVGGPDFELDTRWNFGNASFVKKRLMFFFLLGASENSAAVVDVQLFLNFNLANALPDKTFSVMLTSSGSTWDSAKWDSASWGGLIASKPTRTRVGRTAMSWRARVINRNPDEDVLVFMTGMESELLSNQIT